MSHIAFPWSIGADGRTQRRSRQEQVRDMIEQILFTSPGERVNRPEFGTGLRDALFGPETAAAVELTARAALEKFLPAVIAVRRFEANASDSRLQVLIEYTLLETGETQAVELVRET